MLSCSAMFDFFATSWTVTHQAPAHRILQARILEWVASSFSRGSSQPRDQTCVSCTVGRFFTVWATGETPLFSSSCQLALRQVQISKTTTYKNLPLLSITNPLILPQPFHSLLPQPGILEQTSISCLLFPALWFLAPTILQNLFYPRTSGRLHLAHTQPKWSWFHINSANFDKVTTAPSWNSYSLFTLNLSVSP